MAIKTQYKLQYITDDGEVFNDLEEAEIHERNLRAKGVKKIYHAVLTVTCNCRVEAYDEAEVAEIVRDRWAAGDLVCEEEVSDIEAYEE